MKKMKVIGGLLFVIAHTCIYGQKLQPKELTAARGHYASLVKITGSPTKERAEWDSEKFPFNAEQTEKKLSRKPYYLTDVPAEAFEIPAPPANSSAQTRAELNYLLQLQQQRTKIDVDASLEMAGVFYSPGVKPTDESYTYLRKNLFFIGRSIGTWFHPDSLPVTANLIANVWQDASFYIWSLKYKYLRVRPYKLDTRIQNLENTEWAAYPSGHASNSYVNAFIYQELAPEFADVFMKDAYDMAHSREIIGVHYPSDSESGRMLARQLVNKLFQNERFLKDFEAAKKEWAQKSKGYFGNVVVGKSTELASKQSCASSCASGSNSTASSCSNSGDKAKEQASGSGSSCTKK